ncbi:MAG: ABC transporter ATP-binding protein [Rhodococcus sp. (in: high G+C Gram-positive bacteria)]|uniref:ABC transporter ATP-binding protein n=1 Tax=Rhodococcus sp. TaxID=1831 RepID=UPI002AD68C8C|nr:ABC transporter ATP-binding protein [Rhodococcus sp. (in: high G+C Gram-positive bacteria)]
MSALPTSALPTSALLSVDELQIELITANGIVRAVDGVSFEIAAGETVCIIGESGSGKSTTAMGILGLLPQDLAVLSGRARWKGADVLGDHKALGKIRGRDVALIPQDPMTALSPVHTVGSQLREAVHHSGVRAKAAQTARMVELLDQVHIVNPADQLDRYPHQLSGGMMQRVLIACALAADPSLIVADEPTSALDVTVQASILDLMLELQERTGIGMLLITHDLGVARLMSDRIHVMKSGRFVESGDAQTIVRTPAHAYTKKLLDAVPHLGTWSGAPEGHLV